jgi:hypothetical protein
MVQNIACFVMFSEDRICLIYTRIFSSLAALVLDEMIITQCDMTLLYLYSLVLNCTMTLYYLHFCKLCDGDAFIDLWINVK